MIYKTGKLVLNQLDKKMEVFNQLKQLAVPADGWIKTIRTALNMSLRQLGERMSITPQSLKSMEAREKEGAVTLKTLRDAAAALDMQLYYCFIPNDGSLDALIERKAYELATEIVSRTSASMRLEDQENTYQRRQQSIKELAEEMKREMPKSLWD